MIMPFLTSLVPIWLLHIANFARYGFLYKSFSISPKSFLFRTKLGKNVLIGGGFCLNNCEIGDYTNLSGTEGGGIHSHIDNTVIGKFCSIGKNVQVLAYGHRTDFVSTFPFYSNIQSFAYGKSTDNDLVAKDTIIGNDVWIGTNVTIIGGVKIGDGAIIGAGSVVTKDVAPYTIVAGNPARVIRERFTPQQTKELLRIKWWDKTEQEIEKVLPFLLSSDINGFLKQVKQ